MLPGFTYVRPLSVAEALRECASDSAVLHAGGTDLLGCLRDGVFSAGKVVALSGLKELRGTRMTRDGGLRIGALSCLAEVAAHPLVTERYAALAQAAASVASPQLRNQGTLGGNLCQRPRCWYFRGDFHCLRKGGNTCYAVDGEHQYHCILGGQGCYIVHPSDTAAALVALGGQVRLASPRGSRVLPLESFFVTPDQDMLHENVLAPGELLTAVVLPPLTAGQQSMYRKVRARTAWDFALAGVAVAVKMTDRHVELARLVLSGVAPIPWRAIEAEKVLTGNRLDTETIARTAAASVAGARPLTYNGYKVDLVRGLVEETLQALT